MKSNQAIETQGKCIALYPGAFRPPHAAHLTAVLDLVARPEVDEVVVIISNRCRTIPGTTQAFDSDVALQIWSLYLQGMKKVKVEIAPHSSVKQALGYFTRVKKGDRLLFCIGEKDYEGGDARFEDIEVLAIQAEISATLIPAPTGAISMRATDLRAMLAQGDAGRASFIKALPKELSAAQREGVWTVCREGMKEISEIIQEKIRSILAKKALGEISEIGSARAGKLDPVFRVCFKDGRRYFVKYAGDTVASESLGERLSLKPKRRLSTERRTLNRLRDNGVDGAMLPEVVLFDKETLTLVLTEVCPEGKSLSASLKKGIFDPIVARQAGRFLAQCHRLPSPIAPVWGDTESDFRHWKKMLFLRTEGINSDDLSEQVRNDLKTLKRVSEQACERTTGNQLLILDYTPKNILVYQRKIGVIDFELSSSIGDPAYDLGLFLGHYVLSDLIAASDSSALSAIFEALDAYRRNVGQAWPEMRGRVVSFTGAAMLSLLVGDRPKDPHIYKRDPFCIAAQLLSAGLGHAVDIDVIQSSTIAGRWA